MALSGTDVLLTPTSALSLSLAVHELATNAAKYGSLSRPSGRVGVKWWPVEQGGIQLSWTESGGPRVTQPTNRGFGSTLIEQALAMETGGHAEVHYFASGVVCHIYLPASAVSHGGGTGSTEHDPVPDATEAVAAPAALKVLVAEDSFLLVTALDAVFKNLGWTMIGSASRKAAALALAASAAFDVALLDVNLNGEMSWDVAVMLKNRGIPFVFSTGYDVGIVLPAELLGSPVIGKPCNHIDLEKRLLRAVAESRGAG